MHKKCLILIINLLIALSSLMGQSSALPTGANNDMPVIVNDSLMFIGQHVDSLTEEQRYFNPIYLIVQKGKEYLKNQLIHASVCDCDTTIPNRRIGIFSVAPNKYVSFSQGNLQYFPAANLWKFADNQYEHLGASNKYLSPTYRNWLDLFGWSSDSGKAPFGVSTSIDVADYKGDFVDWGSNWICGDSANTWRTLTAAEWQYVFDERPNALQLRSKGSVNGIRGMILLPDNWILPEGLHFTARPTNLTMTLDINAYTIEEWSKMEMAGAVFLPVTGRRDEKALGYFAEYGAYWSGTARSNTEAYHTYFNFNHKVIVHFWYGPQSRPQGRSVRLVHDTILPQSISCETFEVNGVTFNMICIEGGTFMMGAAMNDSLAEANERPQHQVTISNFMIGQTEVTQELWTAVMGTTLEEERKKGGGEIGVGEGDQLPMYCVSWYDCQAFITRLNEITGKNFRLPTEAEWEFAARGGKHSSGYKYAGSDDPDKVAWYNNENNGQVHKVGTLQPNELGIYDMSGNVWEWCLDGYQSYLAYENFNPIIPLKDQAILRGGSPASQWGVNSLRVSKRLAMNPTNKRTRCGFRLVLSDEVIVKTITLDNKLAYNMISTHGGTFMMGATDNDPQAQANEYPVHQVTLSNYYIGQTSVSQALWTTVMGTTIDDELARNNGETGLGKGDDLPMYGITWFQAQEFATRFSERTGIHFRLPTEAEWEFAARGGNLSHGYKYAGSNDIDSVAWYHVTDGKVKPNALLKPNELGLYDMSGNIWDWVLDGSAPYTEQPQINPYTPYKDSVIHRGGSSHSGWGKHYNRVSFRLALLPTKARTRVGFRLVHDTISTGK